MNAAYIHITLNTIPPIINVTGVLILFAGLVRRNMTVTRTGLVLLLCSALIAVPVFYSGKFAEDIVEHLEGVNAVAIEPHEEAGEWALIVFIVQGVAVLLALIVGMKRTLPGWLVLVTLLISLAASAAVFRTAYLGGRIHHPETQMQ